MKPKLNHNNIWNATSWVVVRKLELRSGHQWIPALNTISGNRSTAINKFIKQHPNLPKGQVRISGGRHVLWDTAIAYGEVACVKLDIVAGLLYGQAKG